MAIPTDVMRQLVEKHKNKINLSFFEAIKQIRGATTKELEELIIQGRLSEYFQRIEAASLLIGDAVALGFIDSARRAVSGIPFVFDQYNPRTVQHIQQNNYRLIREFTQSQRDIVRVVLDKGVKDGVNPREQARRLRKSIGLTQWQENAVLNYEKSLVALSREALDKKLRDKRFDRSVINAISNNQPLTQKQIDKMVNRYREKYIKYRAETIARTESLRAVHEGSNEAWQQAVDSGNVNPDDIERKWVTARDSRVRDSHQILNGQKRKMGETWNGLRFPGDPSAPAKETIQCRCIVTTRVKRKR